MRWKGNWPWWPVVESPDAEARVEPATAAERRMMTRVEREQTAAERETARTLARMASGASLERDGEALVEAEA